MIAFAAVPLLLLVPGVLLVRAAARGTPPARAPLRRAWLQAVVASMAVSSWAGLLLLECGAFGLGALSLALAAFSIALLLVFRPPLRGRRGGGERAGGALPLALVAAAFLLACAAGGVSEHVFGGWDSGEYVGMGALFADRGRIVYRDEFFASVPEDSRDLFTQEGRRYMGFNLLSLPGAVVSPKFMHVYPMWLALASRIAGPRAALAANILFSLLSIALCWRIALRLYGRAAAAVSAAVMALSPLLLWFGRMQCAEPLAALFFLGCVYFWVLWRQGGGPSRAGLSAACAGMMFLVKFDALIVLPALLLALALAGRIRGVRVFALALAAALVHLAVHLAWWDRPYLKAVSDNLPGGPWAFAAAGALLALALIAGRRVRAACLALGVLPRLAVALFLLAAFVFLLYVRPAVSASPEAENLPGLAMIAGDGILWWALAGALVAWLRGLRDDELPLWLAGLAAGAFFSLTLAGERHLYPWSARRFLPVVVPAAAVFAGLFTASLRRLLPRPWALLPGAGLALLLALPLARFPYLAAARDYPGALAFVGRLGEATRPYDVLVCEQVRLAVPLDFLCRRNVLLFKEDGQTPEACARVEALVARWLDEGRRVAYVTSGPAIHGARIGFARAGTVPLRSSAVPLVRRGMPAGPAPFSMDGAVLEAVPLERWEPPAGDLVFEIGFNSFGLGEGFGGPRRFGRRGVGRWTAPEASLIIPWFEDGAGRIEFALSTGSPSGGPVPVEVAVEGETVGRFEAAGLLRDYAVAVPPGTGAGMRRVRLRINAPRGVFLDKVRIARLP
ncbi:MAG: glycosyltransferase family 39 protein [bacterium]|nr:glycosyltransferase family 39 protein [bacterium]